MTKAVIGIGSNIAPEKNIRNARAILAQKFQVLAESEFVTTKPIGNAAQPDFINGAVLIESPVTHEKLAEELKAIEKQLGRKESVDKFAPRTIDLDIVVFNGEVTDQDFYSRDFLKTAVLEVLPTLKY